MGADVVCPEDGATGCCCVNCDHCICQEFTVCNLGLDYPTPREMVTCQWAWPEWIYLTWRIAGSLYFFVWIILSGLWEYDWAKTESDRVKWFIYLTNWTFIMFTLQLLMQTTTACLYRVHVIDADRMTPVLKAQWVLYNIASPASFIVSAAFWALLSSGDPHPVDIHTHGINCAYILVDLFITAQPMRLLHFLQTESFFIAYCLFSLVYHFAGGTNGRHHSHIYSALDWNDLGTAIVYILIFMFLLIPFIFLLQFGLYKLRLYIKQSFANVNVEHELT